MNYALLSLSDEQKALLSKVTWLKRLNVVFILLSVIALIFEVTIFSFENWFVDTFLTIEVIYITMNLGFILLHEDAQAWWVRLRIIIVFIPFAVIVALTIVQLCLINKLLNSNTDPNLEQNTETKLYFTLALLLPSIPVVLQGTSFCVLSIYQNRFFTEDKKRRLMRDMSSMSSKMSEYDSSTYIN